MSIIKSIFYGTLDMQDAGCDSTEYSVTLKELIAADLALREALTEKQTKLLERAKECSNRLNDITLAEVFEEGFRLGSVLMLEILLPRAENES